MQQAAATYYLGHYICDTSERIRAMFPEFQVLTVFGIHDHC